MFLSPVRSEAAATNAPMFLKDPGMTDDLNELEKFRCVQ